MSACTTPSKAPLSRTVSSVRVRFFRHFEHMCADETVTRLNHVGHLYWARYAVIINDELTCMRLPPPLRRLCRPPSPLSGLQSLSQAWCPCLPPPLRRRCCARRLRCAPQQASRRPRWFQRHVLKERKLNTVVELPDPKDAVLQDAKRVLYLFWGIYEIRKHFEHYIL